MSKTIFLIFLSFISAVCFSQASLENYPLQNIGYISIPANMEMQPRKYTIGEDYEKEKFKFEVSDSRIVFQQKGINGDEKNELSPFARVILKTTVGNAGDFEKLTTKLTATASELSKLNTQIRNQMARSFIGTGVKIVKWHGVKIVNVNGITALNISYTRQLNDQPNVIVSIYQFSNNDRLHKLTLSHAEQDAENWKLLSSKILTSFTITNVR